MSEEPQEKPMGLAAMPGILVIVTLGYLFVMHAGSLLDDGARTGEGLEADYLEAGARYVREPVNRARGRLGLVANDVVQRDGELFYLPDIEHLMGASFLADDEATPHVVLKSGARIDRERNPLAGILDFDRQLRARGIRLVLLPTPSKAMFAGPGKEPMRNAGFDEFLEELRKNDIACFDLAPHFADYKERGNSLFLKTDSHWTPETMRLSAVLLTAYLKLEKLLPEGSREEIAGSTERITNTGDLGRLLDGGSSARWQETIAIHPLQGSGGERWVPDRESPALLLGDSFTNVFSLRDLGWGEEAGLAESLSQAIGFPVDRIARNAGGALASRRALREEASRLQGKKLVVWQFAARELSMGDWRPLSIEERAGAHVDLEGAVTLEGTIAAVAPVPAVTRTPYRRAVMEIRLIDVKSEGGEMPAEVVLLGLGVEDRVPTAMTQWKVGETVKVKIVDWREVEERFGRLHRFALEDPELELLEAVRVWMVE